MSYNGEAVIAKNALLRDFFVYALFHQCIEPPYGLAHGIQIISDVI